MPDTIKMDDTLRGEFHAALDGFRADPVKGAQPLIAMHEKAMQAFAEQTTRNQFDVFNKTKTNWEKQTMADPELGGAGHMTAMGAVARARDALVSSAPRGSEKYNADWKEFNEMLAVTGAGSHPAFLRMTHNAARYIDEPQASQSPLTDLKPPKNNGRSPGSKMYDHPTSQKVMKS